MAKTYELTGWNAEGESVEDSITTDLSEDDAVAEMMRRSRIVEIGEVRAYYLATER